MLNDKIIKVISQFQYAGKAVATTECKKGHINSTYFVDCVDKNGRSSRYVLQAINTNVFKNPDHVMHNMLNVTEHIRNKLKEEGKDYHGGTVNLIPLKKGGYVFKDDDGKVWRSYEYIVGESYQTADSPQLMEFVGRAFGDFQMRLSDFDASKLYETIPDFHNTISRMEDFEKAVKRDLMGRADSVKTEIDFIIARKSKCGYIMDGIASGKLPLRVTHNDTKLNNIMINGDSSCVIDLDTVMPGSVLADFGDAIRFGASNSKEDESDLSKVYLRLDMFESFTKGFVEQLGDSLTRYEIESFPMGAYLMTLELAMRFLGDYLNGDKYFRILYPEHNLVRARKQIKLVEDMEKKMPQMQKIVNKYI